MNNNDYFVHSELALAAYADLEAGHPDVGALQNEGTGLSLTQAQNFSATWTVIDQMTDTFTGLSVTLFQDNTGAQAVAIRGTEVTDLADIMADGGILLHGIPNWSAQYQALKSQIEQWQLSGAITGSFSVTGHSLGGWLAGGLTVDFAESIEHAYLYNAPGVFGGEGQLIDWFNQAFGTNYLTLDLDRISNVRASVGASPISGLGMNVAPTLGVEIEDHQLGNHSMKYLTDSLAVYNLFASIDSSLSLETIGGILKASAREAENTLESAVSAIGELLLPGVNFRTGSEYDSNRDLLYQDLHDITITLENRSGLSIEILGSTAADGSFTPDSPTKIEGLARSDIAYRYALVNGNPFAILGVDYSNFNQNGELDIYNPATGLGQLTIMYLVDRAEMLANLIYCNIHDTTDAGDDGADTIRVHQFSEANSSKEIFNNIGELRFAA